MSNITFVIVDTCSFDILSADLSFKHSFTGVLYNLLVLPYQIKIQKTQIQEYIYTLGIRPN